MKFAGCITVVVTAVLGVVTAQLPTVDLGYEVHQALAYNDTGRYYNFSNIRFAQPPVGDLRFARPVPPAGRNPVVQNGAQGVICPQASPAWQLIGLQFAQAFSNGSLDAWNYTRAKDIAIAQLTAAAGRNATPDARSTEDCLFLDVFAPKAAFDARNCTGGRNSTNSTGAPVILWFHGGGYTLGSKYSNDPSGLIDASLLNSTVNATDGVIFVAANYRLGALGWLGGPSFQFEGGISNAALYDQRLAIQWVRERIHLFGGDPNRITLMGESAGAGSIMHQMTAYGNCKGQNFQQAIIQSPGWFPISSQFVQENTTQTFYKMLNVSSLEEARRVNTSAIIRANALQVGASSYGTYTYGPTVDGIFVPAQPGIMLGNGAWAKNINIMAGHNTYEGVFFAPSYVQNEDDFNGWLAAQYPNAPRVIGEYIAGTLYPPVYDGSYNYTSPITRAIKIVTEQIFTCNTNYMARAKEGRTYNYEFQVSPALHGYDVAYTFAKAGTNTGINRPVANALQGYISNFAKSGSPNNPAAVPPFPMHGSQSLMVGLNTTGINIQTDPTENERCRFWQKYLYT